MDTNINLKEILEQHKLWLEDSTKGKRADLRVADLSCADLSGADLRGADLRGAILDYSAWPLKCGSFHAKADDRLVLQLFAHITRLNTDGCSKDVQKIVKKLPGLAKNGFIKYRSDVEKI